MKVINQTKIEEFVALHQDAVRAMNKWLKTIKDAKWEKHADLKQMFPSADYVGNSRYVFNIKGNNYRIVAIIVFVDGLAAIRFVGSHQQYERIDCTTI
jgi:mRNA interferase HigB